MKNLTLNVLSFLFIFTAFGQSKPPAMNREDYMVGCLESAKSLPNVPASEYCDCTYDQLISRLSDEEINEFLDFMATGAEQDDAIAFVMGKPKIMNIIMGCLEPKIIKPHQLQPQHPQNHRFNSLN
jgi:hypothetical protein